MEIYPEYIPLELWTRRVRAQTRKDWRHLQQDRAWATSPPTAFEQRMMKLGSRLGLVKRTVQGGIPAVERFVMRLVSPGLRPEHLLPETQRRG